MFLILAVVVGRFWSQRIFSYAARLQVSGALLGLCICFCFALATLAGLVGLAPIVGAFAAGVVLEEVHYKPFLERGERKVQELLFPLTTLVVPVFFVLMGFRVDLRSFSSAGSPGFRRGSSPWPRSSESRFAHWAFWSAAWTASSSGWE